MAIRNYEGYVELDFRQLPEEKQSDALKLINKIINDEKLMFNIHNALDKTIYREWLNVNMEIAGVEDSQDFEPDYQGILEDAISEAINEIFFSVYNRTDSDYIKFLVFNYFSFLTKLDEVGITKINNKATYAIEIALFNTVIDYLVEEFQKLEIDLWDYIK